jgi:hypothetical protein
MVPLILALDFVSLGMRALLVTIIFKRGLHRVYPFFSLYLAFSVVSTVLRLLLNHDYKVFFYVFWATDAAYAILAFLVITEVFRSVFREFCASKVFQAFLACAALAILALTLTAPIGHHLDVSSTAAIILSMNLGVRMLQVGMLALFLGLALFFDMRQRRYEIGIVLGYGLFAVVYLIALSLRSQLGVNYRLSVALGHPIAYDCAVVIWLWAFSRPQQSLTLQGGLGPRSPESTLKQLTQFTRAYRRLAGE